MLNNFTNTIHELIFWALSVVYYADRINSKVNLQLKCKYIHRYEVFLLDNLYPFTLFTADFGAFTYQLLDITMYSPISSVDFFGCKAVNLWLNGLLEITHHPGMFLTQNLLAHVGQIMPYADIDLGEHWLC